MADKTAGNAGIEIHPDFDKFIGEIRTFLDAAREEFPVTVRADTAEARADIDELTRDREMRVKVRTDDSDLATDLDEVETAASKRQAKVPTRTDSSGVGKDLDDIEAQAAKRDAKVPTRPDPDVFQKDLIRQLDAIKNSTELKIPLTTDGEQVRQSIREAYDGIRQIISEPLPSDPAGAANTRRALQDSITGFRSATTSDLATLGVALDPATGSKLKTELTKFKKDIGEAGTITMQMVGVTGAAGAVAQLLAVADAAAQATHLLGLLPAAGAGVAAGAAAVKVGSFGLSDVAKAYSAVDSDPVGVAIKTRDATNALADSQYQETAAQRSVQTVQREAVLDQRDLQDAYRQTSRSIRDVNLDLESQKIDAADAATAVSESAKHLQEVNFDPAANADTRQQALDDYERSIVRQQQATNKLADGTQDTARANALGVAGSTQVIQAQDKMAASANAQSDAAHQLTQAIVGVQRAQEQLGEATGQTRIDSALARISPNARQAVADIRTIGPAWHDVRFASEDALTNGMGPAVEKLAAVQLPNLKQGFVGIDGEINRGLRSTLATLSTETSRTQLGTFFSNTTAGFGGLANAAAPATQALTTLVSVGSAQFPALGHAVDDAATKFDNFILRTSGSGQLQTWLQQGITSAEQLAQIAEHLGSSLASVFHAADGGSVVKTLDDLTGHMAQFLKSGQGQADLASIFTQMRQEGEKFVPIIKDLPRLLQGVTQGVKLWSDITLPFLHEAADLLGAHPELVTLAIAAYAGFKTVGPILDGAKLAIDYLAKSAGAAGENTSGVGKLKAAGQGLLGILGNPWTLAITGAVAGMATFEQSANADSSAVTRFAGQAQAAVDANNNLQKALQSSGGALDSGVIDAETNSVKQLRDALSANANDTPGLADWATAGLAKISGSFTGLGGGIAANFDVRQSVDQSSKAMVDAFSQIGLTNDQLSQKITGSKPAFDSLLTQLSDMGQGGKDAAAKLETLRDEWAIDANSVTPVASAIKDLGDKNADAANSIDAATSAMERQRQNGLTLEDAQLKVNEALTGLGTAAQTASGAVIQANGAIDTSSKQGQLLYQLLNQQLAPAWDQATSAAYRNAIQQGQTADQAQQAAQQSSDAVKTSAEHQIESMGYTQAQADQLLAHYQPLAKNFNATFTADTSQASTALQNFQKQLDGIIKTEGSLPLWMQPLAAQQGLPGQYHQDFPSTQAIPGQPSAVPPWLQGVVPAHATGAYLQGPGTPTSDSMIIRASTEEYLSKAASVRKYGVPFYEALNAGKIDPALIAALPAFADGGLVGGPGAGTAAITAPAGAGSIPQLIAFARSLVGQPYGGALDCSGLISELALDAAGLSPTSGRMATSTEGTWLGALGWTSGTNTGTGIFSVGWINDPGMPGGGHTAGTLPNGDNIESSGSAGKVLIGTQALGSNATLFNQHSYLLMSGGNSAVGAPAPGTLAAPSPTASTQQVINPQAPLPAPHSDAQLEIVSDRAAVDSANSERNAVYANAASTAQDKEAADIKFEKAQNALGQAMQTQQTGAATLFSAQGAGTALGVGLGAVIGAGIGASFNTGEGQTANAEYGGAFGQKFGGRLGGILAGGLLGSLGLDQSVLSEGNAWNSAFQKGIAAAGAAGTGASPLGYYYTPKNLPTIVTTTTTQPAPTTLGGATYAGTPVPGAAPAANAAAHVYDPAGGAQQWLGDVQHVLQATGRNVADASETVSQIGIESSGNPNAENDTPAGIAAGTPIGLLQVIKTTFDANVDPRFPGTQTTPDANIAAALNYVDGRYGGPSHIWPTSAGYADGGWVDGAGGPRTDSIPMLWWGSNGERLHVTNAAGAAQNAPFLDAVNSGARFQPLEMPSSYEPGAGGDGGDVHNHYGTVNVHEPRIMDMGEFMEHVNQRQAMATLGSMSAWPV